MALDTNLVSHFLLNNNADDNFGAFDGSEVGTVDFTGDKLDPLLGSVTIPATGGVWASWWVDTGTGFTFASSLTVPSSLATDNYSNLRVYSVEKTGVDLIELQNEGYYPKPLIEPTTTGLVVHYPLTGTAEDSTGVYDGTEIGVTYVDDIEFGSVSLFNGTNSEITTNHTPSDGVFSISVDVDFTLFSGGTILSTGAYSGANTGVLIFINGGELKVWITNGIELVANISFGVLPTGSFNTIGVSWDNTTNTDAVKLYINGALYATGTSSSVITSHTETLEFGNYNSLQWLNGKLRNARVYNRELTAQEFEDIYNYEKNFRAIDIDDGLIAYYPLKNNSLDNYYNEYDATDNPNITYDGEKATIPSPHTITFPTATGFVEAYYIKDDVFLSTTVEADLNALTDCTLSQVRKYNRSLSVEEIAVISRTNSSGNGTLTLTATADASVSYNTNAFFSLTGTATPYVKGEADASFSLSGTAVSVIPIRAVFTLNGTATSTTYAPLETIIGFRFVQEIEQSLIDKPFIFVQEIEQVTPTTIIQRVNV